MNRRALKVALCSVCLLPLAVDGMAGTSARHRVTLPHPAKERAVELVLIQSLDETGAVTGYRVDVDSVICVDEKCDVITVRLHWDELGRFRRYELPEGGELTKRGHQTFTRADHAKLQRILSDPDSPLRWVTREQIVPPETAMEEVDGTTGATALSRKNTVVAGAAYTCYTLWHWANGKIVGVARRLTGEAAGQAQLLHYLERRSDAHVLFALAQLTARGIHDREIVEAVIRRTRRSDESLAKPALAFLESASVESGADFLHSSVERLWPDAGDKMRILCLRVLSTTSLEPPDGFLDRVSAWFSSPGSYQQVHFLLTLVARGDADSPAVVKQVMPLLEHRNFLIARRAFWFLDERELDAAQRRRVEAFRVKFAHRL